MARYVASDLHGVYSLWEQIRDSLTEIDTLYYLGDAVDRGPDGIKILREMLADDRVIILKGNHEDMMCDTISKLLEKDGLPIIENHFPPYGKNWFTYNGGEVTYNSIIETFDNNAEDIFNFITQIKNLPLHAELRSRGRNIYLSHSGYEPWLADEDWSTFDRRYKHISDRYIWDREHIHHIWGCPQKFNEESYIFEDDPKYLDFDFEHSYVIHGHTPVYCENTLLYNTENRLGISPFDPFTKEDLLNLTISRYDDHKIDIDLGSAQTGAAALLSLDTFDEKYFYDKGIQAEWAEMVNKLTDRDLRGW